MARDLDIALLRAFAAVVDTGSVTAAARLLNRTQSAVSQQIKRLEELLEVELFVRDHKRLTLAPSGERLLAQASRMIALNDETWGMITRPDFTGEVRLGIPCDIVPTYAPQILRRFGQAWPSVHVSLLSGNSVELLEQLDSGEIDVTLTTDLLDDPGPFETLRLDRLVWVIGRDSDAARRDPLPLSVGGRSCRFKPVVLDALRRAGRDWRYVLEVSDQQAVNATVAAGLAVSALLRDSVPIDLEVLPPEAGLPELPMFAVNLYLPRTGASELGQELACHIRSEFLSRFGPIDSTVVDLTRGSPATRPGRRSKAA